MNTKERVIHDQVSLAAAYDVPPDYVPTFMLAPPLETGKVE
jgi:hypothetical protein